MAYNYHSTSYNLTYITNIIVKGVNKETIDPSVKCNQHGLTHTINALINIIHYLLLTKYLCLSYDNRPSRNSSFSTTIYI